MTATTSDLCDRFTRRTKGKGRPSRDAVCGVCDATYRTHYPVGDPLPKLAFPVLPETCLHFTKKDGKRGKPSPTATCAVCERVWNQHHPRGKIQPVKHPKRVVASQIGLSPKQGSTLTKTGIDTPIIQPVVEVIEEPQEGPQEPETVEPETVEPEPEVETIIEPPAEAFIEPEETEPKKPKNAMRFWEKQYEDDIAEYMAKGLTREEAEKKYKTDNDW